MGTSPAPQNNPLKAQQLPREAFQISGLRRRDVYKYGLNGMAASPSIEGLKKTGCGCLKIGGTVERSAGHLATLRPRRGNRGHCGGGGAKGAECGDGRKGRREGWGGGKECLRDGGMEELQARRPHTGTTTPQAPPQQVSPWPPLHRRPLLLLLLLWALP